MEENKNKNYIDKKRRKKDLYCTNCGKLGHSYKNCQEPITSYGVIVFRRVSKDNKSNSILSVDSINEFNLNNNCMVSQNCLKNNTIIKYLLIRRKDSLNYVEFLRGRYDLEDTEFIYMMFNEMTNSEIDRIKNHTCEDLWRKLWKNNRSGIYKNEFDISNMKIKKIKNGYYTKNNEYVSLQVILDNIKNPYIEPEWGFPKGRRNNKESDLEASEREFQEETGFRKGEYNIIYQLNSVSETFKGSNGIMYKHVYYIAHCPYDKHVKINPKSRHQIIEIGDIGWFDYDEAIKYFRTCDVEKVNLLNKINNVLENLVFSAESIKVI